MHLHQIEAKNARVEIVDSDFPGYCVISVSDEQGAVFLGFRLNKEYSVEKADYSSFTKTSEHLPRELFFRAAHIARVFLLSKTIGVVSARRGSCIMRCGKYLISFIENRSGRIERLGFEPRFGEELFQILFSHAAAVIRAKRKEPLSPEESAIQAHERETRRAIVSGKIAPLVNYARATPP